MKGATLFAGDGDAFADVSIHAPNEGSDHATALKAINDAMFQSTLPMKGATNI